MMEITQKVVFEGIIIEKESKRGKRGVVYLAWDSVFHQRCIYREFQGENTVYSKLKEIDCQNLPKIYRIGQRDGLVCVLEEYIQGDSLAFLLEGGTLSPAAAGEIMVQLCDALKKIHAVGVVHRDIKPENIIIRDSEAVLVDFDASRVVKTKHPTDTHIMGTTGYAAPEQYGFSQTDARADVYSMGVLLNEMLTRQHPSKVLAAGKLRPVIEKCIEVNVDKRYQTAEELRAAVQKAGKPACWKNAAIAALLLLLGAAGCLLVRDIILPDRGQEPEIMEQPEVTADSERELYGGRWPGTGQTSKLYFRYDLDGDGTGEIYKLGIMRTFRRVTGTPSAITSSHRKGKPISAMCTLHLAVPGRRLRAACAGVYRVADRCEGHPVAGRGQRGAAPGDLDPEWSVTGGIQVLYTLENQGKWIYEITATLGNQTMTALATTVVG